MKKTENSHPNELKDFAQERGEGMNVNPFAEYGTVEEKSDHQRRELGFSWRKLTGLGGGGAGTSHSRGE